VLGGKLADPIDDVPGGDVADQRERHANFEIIEPAGRNHWERERRDLRRRLVSGAKARRFRAS